MSDFLTDLSGLYLTGLESASATRVPVHATDTKAGKDMDMQDFLQLMVATFQNQTIDNTADVGDMMNQMVQMSVVQAITNISSLITESTNMSYAASLVGKEVTIAQTVGTKTTPITGTVTGTGVVNGKQVVFVNDESYWLSDIMAVGRLPDQDSASAKQADEASDEALFEALDQEAFRSEETEDTVDELAGASDQSVEDLNHIPEEILEEAVQEMTEEL